MSLAELLGGFALRIALIEQGLLLPAGFHNKETALRFERARQEQILKAHVAQLSETNHSGYGARH
ncbi:MAG: hypothetical protein AB7O04_07365 [Hyphomonadaceae bacterium]